MVSGQTEPATIGYNRTVYLSFYLWQVNSASGVVHNLKPEYVRIESCRVLFCVAPAHVATGNNYLIYIPIDFCLLFAGFKFNYV